MSLKKVTKEQKEKIMQQSKELDNMTRKSCCISDVAIIKKVIENRAFKK